MDCKVYQCKQISLPSSLFIRVTNCALMAYIGTNYATVKIQLT